MDFSFNSAASGFVLGLSLILAIGAQNAFVLKQGLRREHVFWICLCCAVSDAVLILLGVGGFALLIQNIPALESIARYGGALFLGLYALLSLKSAWIGESHLEASNKGSQPLTQAILVTLAFTWLNPHVYLDTVVLLGSVSAQYQPHQSSFALGAVLASFCFFFSLGYGARLLKPWFEKPKAWQVLDIGIALVMISIALSLIWPA